MLASELINEDPSLSLRQIARAAGISPETARDVRNRLRRGEDPLPDRRRVEQRRGDHHQRRAEPARQAAPADGAGPGRAAEQDRAAVVMRLKADPALRFTETGRNLLRLLTMHTLRPDDWSKIIDNVPPHCTGIIAELARDCADAWAEFAVKIEHRPTNMV